MRNDRHLAIKLRKKGLSYKKISKELGIPKSTLNSWFQGLIWSDKIKDELTARAVRTSKKRIRRVLKTNSLRRKKLRQGFIREAETEFIRFKSNHLFIAGVMLYWGEGDQNLKYPVRLANINHKMIALFNKFLLEICGIKKENIYLSLFIYPDISEKECKKFWSNKIKIKQFDKVQVIYGKHPTRRLENGICSIRVKSSPGIKQKIVIWISLLSSNLLNYKMRV